MDDLEDPTLIMDDNDLEWSYIDIIHVKVSLIAGSLELLCSQTW